MSCNRTVYIVDDDALIRHSMELILEDAGFRTQSYGSAFALLDSIEENSVGCVVADVKLPDMSGMDLLAELKRSAKRLRVIIITGHADVALAVRAMKEGAVDFIEKPFQAETLVGAVRRSLPAQSGGATAAAPVKRAMLSDREKAVFDKLVAGKSNKIIAYELGISVRTVEAHRASIKRKTGAGNIADLVRIAIAAE